MTVSTYRPTTMTENAQIIIQTSRALWDLYRDANKILNHATVIVTKGQVIDQAQLLTWINTSGNIPDWNALAENFGLLSGEHAQAAFWDMAQAFGQINAETINGSPNYLRAFMHRVG